MIKGAVFDLDGTITDSNPFWNSAPVIFLESLGIKADPDIGQIVFSMTVPETVDYMIKKYSLTLTPEEFMEVMHRIIEHFYTEEVELKPDIRNVLDLMKGEGIPIAIATMTEHSLVDKALHKHGIADYFSGIVTTDEAGAGKNDPTVYQMAADKTGSGPEETLVFEDSLFALRTARSAGFITVGVYDEASFDTQDELRSAAGLYLPDYKDLSDLAALFRN